jgi:hypothetical protein
MTRLPLLLLLEGSTFVAASLVHRGFLLHGYAHGKAAIAETVIGAVLLAGAAAARVRPARARAIALAAQGFALLGTAVGLFTIAVGVGPRTVPDLAYHAAIVSVLVAGVVAVARRRPDALRSTRDASRRRAPA